MNYEQGNATDLKDNFWQAMTQSSFVMLQLDEDQDTAALMTAQLDKDAKSAIWFFTGRNSRLGTK